MTETCDQNIVVLFSGGKDRTCAAWLLSQRFKSVHLLTMKTGTAQSVEKCEVSVQRLQKRCGKDKFVHRYVDGSELFRKLHFGNAAETRRLFGPTAESAACVTCHAVMHALAIADCKQNGIRWVAAGVSPQSRMSFGQSLRGVGAAEAFFARYGVKFTAPLWEDP